MKRKEHKGVNFGAWKVNIWEASDGVFRGEAVLASPPKGVDVPSIMRDGIPFTVTPEGVEGKSVKYIFPQLIPRILDALK